MRQVDEPELIQMIQRAMQGWTPALFKRMQHHDPDERLKGRLLAATLIADRMKRLEILSSAPEGPPVNYAALSGTSGMPAQDEDGYARKLTG